MGLSLLLLLLMLLLFITVTINAVEIKLRNLILDKHMEDPEAENFSDNICFVFLKMNAEVIPLEAS